MGRDFHPTANKLTTAAIDANEDMSNKPCTRRRSNDLSWACASKQVITFHATNRSFKFLLVFIMLILYMCVCALVFRALESDHDRHQYRRYKKRKIFYKEKFNLSEAEFVEFVEEVSLMNKLGYMSGYKDYWNFYHSFWFTITVITTMGFGHVVPVTFGGRLFCIVCALVGIPLNAVFLKNVGERFMRLICSVLRYAERRMRGRQDPVHIGIKAAVTSFVVMVIVLLVGGALDTIFDGWTFFDGVYFNFIALSTIGFGDLFPRVERSSKLDKLGLGESGKRLFASFIMLLFMFVGLSVVSTVICSIFNAIEEVSQVPARIQQKSTIRRTDKPVTLTSIRVNSKDEKRDAIKNGITVRPNDGVERDITVTPAAE